MSGARANYRNSEFYNAAREFDREEITINEIDAQLTNRLSFAFNAGGSLRIDDFYNLLHKKFKGGGGYYTWSGIRYFLYEYELSLLSESRQKKVDWSDLLKTPKDKISIEHIYPQTETPDWTQAFGIIPAERRGYYKSTLGNLLLLSAAINSSLQNDSFAEKRQAKSNSEGKKIRNGYADGSHSEIEVAQEPSWGPAQILERGLKLLSFMEVRWDFKFGSDGDRKKMLFLDEQ